ncbi:AMP-binding protein [Gordonia sp. HY002]|uniref:AMP-binding protein n=1 Tax=Gordonia zhenghanii TaxID=2911516 RepID=UPI001EEFF07E|nr:AMP-binding protein [Gordonia zhenghanii]MCF8571136.1 AMP-binding protein [Gordonia zhenghanii]MCF8604656.1 AMP-binding protein [Gordonia zhenghanii]
MNDEARESADRQVADWLDVYGAPDASVANLLCDRHDRAAVAFTLVEPDLSATAMTYGELADESRRMATVLAAHGVTRGDRVPVLLGKRRALVITLVALWRTGAVHVPLFTAFATGAIRLRVEGSGAQIVVTDASQRDKVDPIDAVLVLDVDDLVVEAQSAEPANYDAAVGGDGAFVQLYTSGTTGKPKGVPVPVRALASFQAYQHFSLDVAVDDVFWNAADPGWAYGLYYAVITPLVAGRTSLLFNAGFTPDSTVAVLKTFGVTNFAGAPTMYRALRAQADTTDIGLRRASSAGEPLTPDIVEFGRTRLGCEVRDHYGQTEIGMVIGNHWNTEVGMPLKPGSMGQAMPGYVAGIVDGQIAIDVKASPALWFTGYDAAPEKTADRFTDDGAWYLTADTGKVDDEGYFSFTARDDDVILAAGYRIGPFDVESVMVTHASVAEVAVVGRPDPEGIRGEVVEAFVVLNTGFAGDDALASELQAVVRDEYSKHAYPRTVHFVESLPKTPSGKVQRFVLRRGGE